MDDAPVTPDAAAIDLKDRDLAGLLAWLVPGLGHFYQGRYAKACLFFVLILGTFVWGLYLGGDSEVGWGRSVYASWRTDDHRWHYFCQLGIGLPAFPALIQAYRGADQPHIWWHGFMAPPRLKEDPDVVQDPSLHLRHPTESTLNYHLHRFFELGTIYTMLAGLMNILAIYDAWEGPVWQIARRKDDEQNQNRATHQTMYSLLAAAEAVWVSRLTHTDLWYALPLIVAISLVYEATRNERMTAIFRGGLRLTVIGVVSLVGLLALLWLWALCA